MLLYCILFALLELAQYAKRVTKGIQRASTYAAGVLSKLLGNSDIELNICPELNVSKCDISQEATLELGTDIYIVAYNALASPRSDVVGIPVSSDGYYKVWNLMASTEVDSVLLPQNGSAGVENSSKFMLYFETGEIPAVGGVTYRIEMIDTISSAITSTAKLLPNSGIRGSEDKLVINNGEFNLYADRFVKPRLLNHLQVSDNAIFLSLIYANACHKTGQPAL